MGANMLPDWLVESFDRSATEPAYRQLFRLIQQAILSGQLATGIRLPSSRALCTDLGIARNTVLQVYEQLLAEGYVETHCGSGTYVADTSPATRPSAEPGAARRVVRDRERLSARGRRTIELSGVSKQQWGAFMPGVPDVTEFPRKAWNRLQNRVWRRANPELMTYAPGGGFRPLRRALADYLRIARSASCEPEQVMVTTGVHQSVDLAVRLLGDPGDTVWIEEPCYWGLRGILLANGLTLVPIPVDAEGMKPEPRHLANPPRLIICTPSHQYPLGMVMSLARRRMLLEYARQHGCWIIEDDYDSEFRFGIRPLASLQGLDADSQVIYLSSFSKTLFPGLRIGYMVVPGSMADLFALGLAELYREGQLMQQAVLAEFIDEGMLTTHIRRMRGLYAERRTLLIDAVRQRCGDRLPVMGGDAGLHLVLGLPQQCDDWEVVRASLQRGIVTRPLSAYYSTARRARPGLLLGYGCVPHERIAPSFNLLADAIENVGPLQATGDQAAAP